MPQRSITTAASSATTRTTHLAATGPHASQACSALDLWLGEMLRQQRKSQGLALRDVAASCGISVSLLSQIERGLRSVSLRTLTALANQLGTPLESLLRNSQHSTPQDEAHGALVRAGHHTRIDLEDKGIYKENLTPPASSGKVEMYRAVIQPGGSTGHELFCTHPSQQVGYVTEGQLELVLDKQLLMLHAGDSFCYDGSTPRRWRNPGTTVTTVLWSISHSRT